MGRYSTGAIITEEVLRLELSGLIKDKLIQKGLINFASINWTNGSSISITSCYKQKEKYVRLNYTNTDTSTGKKEHFDYKIQLITIPSNLGKGEILYFKCPITGKRARVLYKCYGSSIWKSREAYKNRIYYSSQISSKLYHPTNEYFKLEKKIDKLIKKRKKLHYKGKETKLSKRIYYLSQKKREYDVKRMILFDQIINKYPFL